MRSKGFVLTLIIISMQMEFSFWISILLTKVIYFLFSPLNMSHLDVLSLVGASGHQLQPILWKIKWKLWIFSGAVQQLWTLQGPFHLPCLRLRAELLSELSCRAGWQRCDEDEICSRDGYEHVCARVCVWFGCIKALVQRFTTQTRGQQVGSISFQAWEISHV